MKQRQMIFIILWMLVAACGFADEVILNSGEKVEGAIVKEGTRSLTVRIQYGEMEIQNTMIQSIHYDQVPIAVLGKRAFENGKYRLAVKHYQKALESGSPENQIENYIALACCYYQIQAYKSALKAIAPVDEAASPQSLRNRVLFLRWSLYRALRRQDEADHLLKGVKENENILL